MQVTYIACQSMLIPRSSFRAGTNSVITIYTPYKGDALLISGPTPQRIDVSTSCSDMRINIPARSLSAPGEYRLTLLTDERFVEMGLLVSCDGFVTPRIACIDTIAALALAVDSMSNSLAASDSRIKKLEEKVYAFRAFS